MCGTVKLNEMKKLFKLTVFSEVHYSEQSLLHCFRYMCYPQDILNYALINSVNQENNATTSGYYILSKVSNICSCEEKITSNFDVDNNLCM